MRALKLFLIITTPFPTQIQKIRKGQIITIRKYLYHIILISIINGENRSAVFKNYFTAILKKQPLQHDIIIIVIKYNTLGRIVLKMIATKITSLILSFP